MWNTPLTQEVTHKADEIISSASDERALLDAICSLLHTELLRYNWVGFYMIANAPGEEPMLELGPFRGSMTPHTRIPLNQGICGAAASTGKTVVVDDVNSDARYLACSLETKSELVVPLFVDGVVAGELDIDSHFPAAFGHEDRCLCEYIAVATGKALERLRSR
ncbi:MAG: GAF domain-containing protein [Acidobacteriota bacterium]|nr:GAF domain-containing protein [Acidobacteriota bacterium]